MIIDFFTRKEIKDDGKCDNCKYNVGYKANDPNIIWCDKHISYRRKIKSSCKYYKFTLEGRIKIK